MVATEMQLHFANQCEWCFSEHHRFIVIIGGETCQTTSVRRKTGSPTKFVLHIFTVTATTQSPTD